MLRGKGDYRIERWFAGGVPLAAVRSCEAQAPLPAVVVFHGFDGNKTDDLLRLHGSHLTGVLQRTARRA